MLLLGSFVASVVFFNVFVVILSVAVSFLVRDWVVERDLATSTCDAHRNQLGAQFQEMLGELFSMAFGKFGVEILSGLLHFVVFLLLFLTKLDYNCALRLFS